MLFQDVAVPFGGDAGVFGGVAMPFRGATVQFGSGMPFRGAAMPFGGVAAQGTLIHEYMVIYSVICVG